MQEKTFYYHRTENGNELESFEQQKERVSRAVLDAGARIIETKENEKDNRAASQELREAVNRGGIDCIVVKDKDRLDNNLLAELKSKGVRIIEHN